MYSAIRRLPVRASRSADGARLFIAGALALPAQHVPQKKKGPPGPPDVTFVRGLLRELSPFLDLAQRAPERHHLKNQALNIRVAAVSLPELAQFIQARSLEFWQGGAPWPCFGQRVQIPVAPGLIEAVSIWHPVPIPVDHLVIGQPGGG